MGLFGKNNEEKERKEVKRQVEKMMKSYSKGKIDKDTYLENMMNFTTSYQKKKKK